MPSLHLSKLSLSSLLVAGVLSGCRGSADPSSLNPPPTTATPTLGSQPHAQPVNPNPTTMTTPTNPTVTPTPTPNPTPTPVTPTPPDTAVVTARALTLAPLQSCREVNASLQDAARAKMNRELDAALARALATHRNRCAVIYDAAARADGGFAVPSAPAPSAGGAGAESFSTTNNQVASVDEADFLKNDARYMYLTTSKDFRIVQAWPPTEARVVSRVKIEGQPQKVLVHADRAVVLSRLPAGSTVPGRPGAHYPVRSRECTYGYDCDFTGDGLPWKITVLDIRDRAAPKPVREIWTSGSYIAGRRIGNAIYAVLSTVLPSPSYSVWPAGVPSCNSTLSDEQVKAAFEKLRAENTAKLSEGAFQAGLPSVVQAVHQPDGSVRRSENLLGTGSDCPNFFKEGADPTASTMVLSFDVATTTPPSIATVLSRPGAVYASAQSLYFSVPHQRSASAPWYDSYATFTDLSTVHKFRLDVKNATATPAGSGVVKGRILNQFSMDEHEGFFRIATTTGRTPSPAVHSTLAILQETGGKLETVGLIDNIAPTEDIRSVRFDGARGYVVTFKKTDPLFVFDLSNPRAPRAEGELKIPGFSTYLHPLDAKHVIGLGYDAADQGSFAFFTGVLLQIFDVSNAKDPKLVHKHVIGTRGSSSEALTNHLAFNYFAPKNLLLLPMTICQSNTPPPPPVDAGARDTALAIDGPRPPPPPSGGAAPAPPGLFGNVATFSGLLAFDVTAATGFRERGRMSFPLATGYGCHNWWTDASSEVRRSVVMDDYVFGITGTVIKASALQDLTKIVASVSLTD